MNRMIRGMAGLMVALGASACADDPSVEFGGDEPTKIQATPTVMFVSQGAREEVLFRLVDDRNRSTPTSFEISNVGTGITVELDDEYRPDYIGSDELEFNPIQHQHRYYVTANSPVGTQFTVTSGGISQVIKVNVVPSEIPITFGAVSNGTVDISSENFTFDFGTTFDYDGIIQSPIAISEDGHTATIAATGPIAGVTPVISGARASYMPTIALSAADGTSQLGAGSASAFGGQTPETAPTINLGDGEFFLTDAGPGAWGPSYQGGLTKWYKIVVTEARHLDITVDWEGGNDVDFELVDADLNSVVYQGSSAHPEHNATDVEPGTYYLAIIDFAPSPGVPATWSIHIVE